MYQWLYIMLWLEMAMERGKSNGWGLHPHPACFCLTPSPPYPAWQGKFSCTILALWGPWSPVPSRKMLLLVNLPTTITIVFNKIYFNNKNILEITNKFIHQIKLIFSKNWIILLKWLTRQYHNKNKNLIIQN